MFTHAVCSSCLGLLRSNRSAEPDLVHAFKLFYLLHHRQIQEDKSFIFMKTPQKVVPLAFSQIETIKRTVRRIERVQLLRSDVYLTLLLLTQKFNTPSFSFIRFFFQTKTGELHRTDLAAVWSDSHSSLFRKSLVFSFLYESVKFPL